MKNIWLLRVALFLNAALSAQESKETLAEKKVVLVEQLKSLMNSNISGQFDCDIDVIDARKDALIKEIKELEAEIEVGEKTEILPVVVQAPLITVINPLAQKQAVMHKDIKDLFDGFIPSMFSESDKVLFDELRLAITTREEAISSQLSQELQVHKVDTLLLLCCEQKALQAKIELLATKRSLTTEQIQHLQLHALKILSEKVKDYWATTNKRFPVNLSIAGDYNIYADFYGSYSEIIKKYREGIYTKALSNEIDLLTQQQVKKCQKIEEQLHDASISKVKRRELCKAQKVIALFISSLLKVKTKILAFHSHETDPIRITLWNRYLALTTNTVFNKLCVKDNEFATFFNSFQKVINSFMSNKDFSKQAICELVYLIDSLQKFVKYDEKHKEDCLQGFFWRWFLNIRIFSPNIINDRSFFIAEMEEILDLICTDLLQKTQDPCIKGVLALSSRSQNGISVKAIIESVQHITGKKCANLHDAFVYAMSYASPYLAKLILSKALPQKDLLEKLAIPEEFNKSLFNKLFGTISD